MGEEVVKVRVKVRRNRNLLVFLKQNGPQDAIRSLCSISHMHV